MKQKKLIFSAILALTFGLTFSQSLFVKENSGTETEHTLSGITKLSFSGSNLVVEGSKSGNYALSGVQKLTFNSSDPGGGGGGTGTCVNTNSDFSSGLTGWAQWENSGTTADLAVVGGELAYTNISGATARWHAQIAHNYNFVQGQTYTISFKARSTIDKPIGILIRECVDGDCGTADKYQDETITTTEQTYEFVYEQTEPTYVYGQVLFELADNDSDVFFSEICIKEGNTLNTPNKTLASNNAFRIYPNPVTDNVFSINAPEAGVVNIISLQGKVLKTTNVDANTNTINIDNLSTGVYLVRYTNKKETKTLKLVKS